MKKIATLSALMFLTLCNAGWSAESGLTREQAIQYLQTCERVWYNKAYLYRAKGSHYNSVEDLEANRSDLFTHGMSLLVMSGDKYIEENLVDLKPVDASSAGVAIDEWRRARDIETFNGKLQFRWSDYDNLGSVAPGDPHDLFRDPSSLYSYFGSLEGLRLSELLKTATKFQLSPQAEMVNGVQCVKVTCVLETPNAPVKATLYELMLATQGALYPMRIMRSMDNGQGMKLSHIWDAVEVNKNASTRVWELKRGRFTNLGAQSIHTVEVRNSAAVTKEMNTPEKFTLQFPPDSKVVDTRSGKTLGQQQYQQGQIHPDTTFLAAFFKSDYEDLEKEMNKTYKNNFTPPWGL